MEETVRLQRQGRSLGHHISGLISWRCLGSMQCSRTRPIQSPRMANDWTRRFSWPSYRIEHELLCRVVWSDRFRVLMRFGQVSRLHRMREITVASPHKWKLDAVESFRNHQRYAQRLLPNGSNANDVVSKLVCLLLLLTTFNRSRSFHYIGTMYRNFIRIILSRTQSNMILKPLQIFRQLQGSISYWHVWYTFADTCPVVVLYGTSK